MPGFACHFFSRCHSVYALDFSVWHGRCCRFRCLFLSAHEGRGKDIETDALVIDVCGQARGSESSGGMASLRIGMPGPANGLETKQADSMHQLEDFKTIQLRELTQLARLFEDDLLTRDEYDEAKRNLFKPTG